MKLPIRQMITAKPRESLRTGPEACVMNRPREQTLSVASGPSWSLLHTRDFGRMQRGEKRSPGA